MAPYYKASQLIDDGHLVSHVFFYLQGVYHAIPCVEKDTQGLNPYLGWCELHRQHGVKLFICISAANQRGLSDEQNAHKLGQHAIVSSPFEQVGLGEFFAQLHHCDRLIQFT